MGDASRTDEGYAGEAEFLAKWRELVKAMRRDTAPEVNAPAPGS